MTEYLPISMNEPVLLAQKSLKFITVKIGSPRRSPH